jgi:hypothetical protein
MEALVTIVLTPDVEQALADEAREKGTTLDALANSYLRGCLSLNGAGTKAPAQPRNLAEFLADHIGVLSSVRDGVSNGDLSESTGEQFTALLLAREKEDRA